MSDTGPMTCCCAPLSSPASSHTSDGHEVLKVTSRFGCHGILQMVLCLWPRVEAQSGGGAEREREREILKDEGINREKGI